MKFLRAHRQTNQLQSANTTTHPASELRPQSTRECSAAAAWCCVPVYRQDSLSVPVRVGCLALDFLSHVGPAQQRAEEVRAKALLVCSEFVDCVHHPLQHLGVPNPLHTVRPRRIAGPRADLRSSTRASKQQMSPPFACLSLSTQQRLSRLLQNCSCRPTRL